MQNDDNDIIIIWEAPKIIPPEFRLYYDEAGKVICYTCEKLEGNYIVIDATTYAQARPDIRIIDGKISTVSNHCIVSKLMPSVTDGISCEEEDISIVSMAQKGITKWKLKTYELK
jgi:hypothetical protein